MERIQQRFKEACGAGDLEESASNEEQEQCFFGLEWCIFVPGPLKKNNKKNKRDDESSDDSVDQAKGKPEKVVKIIHGNARTT